MMELGIDIKVSISEIIDINKPELPVYEHIRLKIEEIQKHQFLQWAKQFDNILRNINKIDDTSWYSDKNWLIDQVQFFIKGLTMHSNGGGYYIQIPKKHWKRLTRLYQPPIALKLVMRRGCKP